MHRHLLLISLGRELLDGQQALDQRGRVGQREGDDLGVDGGGGLTHGV